MSEKKWEVVGDINTLPLPCYIQFSDYSVELVLTRKYANVLEKEKSAKATYFQKIEKPETQGRPPLVFKSRGVGKASLAYPTRFFDFHVDSGIYGSLILSRALRETIKKSILPMPSNREYEYQRGYNDALSSIINNLERYEINYDL